MSRPPKGHLRITIPMQKVMNRRILLITGDVLAIAVVTAVGFATHSELGTAPLNRILATLLPLAFGWFLIAPWLGLFDPAVTADPRLLWRPPLAMLFVAPLAAFLRGAFLNSVILPLFVAVLGYSAAVAMLIWRGLWFLLTRKGSNSTEQKT